MTEHDRSNVRDAEIRDTEEVESSAARLFDVRRIIGGLFTVYGVLVLGAGIFDGSAASKKAAGIDINVWSGIGMLALGLLMLLWMVLRPTSAVPSRDGEGGEGGDGGDGEDGEDGRAAGAQQPRRS